MTFAMRQGFLAVALLAPPALAAPIAPTGAGLTLTDAVAYALEHAPALASARLSVDLRALETDNAEARRYPSLDVEADHGLARNYPDPAPAPETPYTSKLALTLTQPLYDNGETSTRIAIARTNSDVATLTVLKTRDDLVLDVVKAWYRVSGAALALAIKREQRDLLDQQMRQFVIQYKQGLKPKQDYLRFDADAQRAVIDVQSAEGELRNAQIDLARAMGRDVAASEPVEVATLDPAAARKQTLEIPKTVPDVDRSWLVRLAQLEDAATGQEVELTRRKNRPEVTLSSGASYQLGNYLNSPDPIYTHDGASWQVALGVKYNLWDGGTRSRDIALAEGSRRAKQLDVEGQRRTLAAQLSGLMIDLGNLAASRALSERLLTTEEESYASLQSEYRQGRVAYLDLTKGLSDLLAARLGFYATHISLLTTLATYRYHEGTLYDRLASL
jgi:outer membrane protein TolC